MVRSKVLKSITMHEPDVKGISKSGGAEQDVSSLPFRRRRFVAADSSRVHFVARTLRRLPFRRRDTSSPAVSSLGHFVAGARRRRWNSPELVDNVTNSVHSKPYLFIVYARLVNIIHVWLAISLSIYVYDLYAPVLYIHIHTLIVIILDIVKDLDLRSLYALVVIYMYTLINNNKTYSYLYDL